VRISPTFFLLHTLRTRMSAHRFGSSFSMLWPCVRFQRNTHADLRFESVS
jgi:hypothetical protein